MKHQSNSPLKKQANQRFLHQITGFNLGLENENQDQHSKNIFKIWLNKIKKLI